MLECLQRCTEVTLGCEKYEKKDSWKHTEPFMLISMTYSSMLIIKINSGCHLLANRCKVWTIKKMSIWKEANTLCAKTFFITSVSLFSIPRTYLPIHGIHFVQWQPNQERAWKSQHKLWNSTARGQCNIATPVQSGSQFRVLSNRGLGSGLISQVPCLGDTIVAVGVKKGYSCTHRIPMD